MTPRDEAKVGVLKDIVHDPVHIVGHITFGGESVEECWHISRRLMITDDE